MVASKTMACFDKFFYRNQWRSYQAFVTSPITVLDFELLTDSDVGPEFQSRGMENASQIAIFHVVQQNNNHYPDKLHWLVSKQHIWGARINA